MSKLHVAVLLAEGQAHVAGGIDAEYKTITNAKIHNPANGAWKTAGTHAFLDGGDLFSAELYYPASWRREPTGSMIASREDRTTGSFVPLHSDRFSG